jgi:Tfp pilus assembly protein PilF
MFSIETALRAAIAHREAGRLSEAEVVCRDVLKQAPRNSAALQLLGLIALAQGRPADALPHLRQAVAADPRQPAFHSNLAEAYRALGELDEARACGEQAIALDPNFPEAHHNLGLALQAGGSLDEAERQFRRALEIRPESAETHFSLGCLLLLLGNFEHGWPEYEWRLRMRGHPSQRIPIPPWDGSSLRGRRLLVYGEQGLGDLMQFVRYVPLLESQTAEVTVMAPPAMLRLLAASGFKNLLPHSDSIPSCDVQCSLLSLPAILGTSLNAVPAQRSYLRADPRLVAHWRTRLAPLSGFKVGIAWQGSPGYSWDRFRSIPLAAFERLARIPSLRLVSLQVGDGARQIGDLGGRFDVLRFDDLDIAHGPFMDTAAAMMNLDLVVTSDTAIAHLAGALGVPAFVALSSPPDWRWLLGRDDSPWYPTLRLFRQSKLGQWAHVFDQMADFIIERRRHEGTTRS